MIKQELNYAAGDRITNKELKEILQRLYDKHQIRERAKATHIVRYGYTFKRCKIRIDGKRVDGMELYPATTNRGAFS